MVSGQLLKAEARGRMPAGAEAQAGIENHDRLIFLCAAFAPTGFDQQRIADFDGLKMPLPRFGPVFAPNFLQSNFAVANLETECFDARQAGCQNFPDARPHRFF